MLLSVLLYGLDLEDGGVPLAHDGFGMSLTAFGRIAVEREHACRKSTDATSASTISYLHKMGKKQSQKPKNKQSSSSGLSFVADSNHVDPGLASLFASSVSRYHPLHKIYSKRKGRWAHLSLNEIYGRFPFAIGALLFIILCRNVHYRTRNSSSVLKLTIL